MPGCHLLVKEENGSLCNNTIESQQLARSNRLSACAARADVGHRCELGVARNPSLVDSGKEEVMNVY